MEPLHASHVRDHWYWRPGWRVGRRFYTWHLTFAGNPEVADLAERYRPVLDGLPGVDRIPPEWLHLTTQGVGFLDEVSPGDVDRIVAAARRECAGTGPLRLRLGPAHIDPEAVMLAVEPADAVRRLRAALRRAIASVRGADGVPEPAEPFTPHVSLAYTNTAGPAAPLVRALTAAEALTTDVTLDACQLIVLHRDTRMYQWSIHAEVPLR